MRIDRPDDDDAPVVEQERRDVAADDADGPDVRDVRADGERVDTEEGVVGESRDRATYYVEFRAAVAAEYRERWPLAERAPVDRSEDEPGSWRGDGGQSLDPPTNEEVGRGCERIRETEETIVTPAMKRIEAEDPERHLVGFEHRLKGQDRIKEKVAAALEERMRTPEAALATVKDAIRYTFEYTEDRYAAGVQLDTARLQKNGFVLVDRRNSWPEEEYKGINSRWRVPENGQLFEVQFHTRISFEAKQLTHPMYEQIRNPSTSDEEVAELRSFQREICAKIPIPSGAADVPNYP